MAMGITVRQDLHSRRISPKAEISGSSQNELSIYSDVDFVGCGQSLEPEHSSELALKAEPLEGGFPRTSENPYSIRDGDPMGIDAFRGNDPAVEDATSGPYYSSHDTTKTDTSEMDISSRAIPSQECDFIDIDDFLGASTTRSGLSLPLDIKEEALETIDLTGIDDQDSDSQRAYWNDSGYASPGSPPSEGSVAFANHSDCVEESRDGKNGIGLDRAEDYRPESTPTSQGLVQHVQSDVIDPALTDPEGKYPIDKEIVRVAFAPDLVLDEMGTGPEGVTDSEGEELYNIEEIIRHKMIKGVRYYRIKWEGYPSSENTWEPVDVFEKCRDLVEEYHRNDECRRKAKRKKRSRR